MEPGSSLAWTAHYTAIVAVVSARRPEATKTSQIFTGTANYLRSGRNVGARQPLAFTLNEHELE